MRLNTHRFPDTCEAVGLPDRVHDSIRREERHEIVCTGGLANAQISIEGLERVQTDVWMSVIYLRGGTETRRVMPQNRSAILQC
ncbi:hypothetical protein [Sulfitobacter sp. SK012]|uniref:hypothetical protein n=1 Tax=Sulfitobacter sp. SK012 TaxID=1389005 RepID=UPI0013B40CA3|nr:hypothetical protein [Sulfitobacter sp. SK012]